MVVVLVFVQGEVLEEAMEQENQYVLEYLGEETSNKIQQQTEAWYITNIKDSGVEKAVYDYFIPKKNTDTGLEKMSPWLFSWMEDRLDTFWWAVYQVVYKLGLFFAWLPYMVPIFIGSLVDGFVVRQKKKYRNGYSSPLRYDYALFAMYALLFIPLLYITTPIAVHPLWVPIWGLCICTSNIILTSNIQQRI